MSIEWN
jgi:hypothetical protein